MFNPNCRVRVKGSHSCESTSWHSDPRSGSDRPVPCPECAPERFPDPLRPGQWNDHFGALERYQSAWASHHEIMDAVRSGRYDLLRPKCSEFVPTLKCPYSCPHCHYRGVKERLGIGKQNECLTKRIEMTLAEARHTLDVLKAGGVEAISFTGGGEPTFHPQIYEIVSHAKQAGFRLSINTNGTFVASLAPEALVSEFEFDQIRVSLDAVGPLHAKMHGYNPQKRDYLADVRNNVRRMRRAKDQNGSPTTLTCCIVFNEWNCSQLAVLGNEILDLGFDRVVVRPVLNYVDPTGQLPTHVVAKGLELIETKLRPALHRIELIVPQYRFASLGYSQRGYRQCLAAGLIANVWPNGAYLCTETSGDPRFLIGDPVCQSLGEIYSSEQCHAVLARVTAEGCSACPITCRPTELNALFDQIEQLRSAAPKRLDAWLDALSKQHSKPNPWLAM